jgi:hypothetical protein
MCVICTHCARLDAQIHTLYKQGTSIPRCAWATPAHACIHVGNPRSVEGTMRAIGGPSAGHRRAQAGPKRATSGHLHERGLDLLGSGSFAGVRQRVRRHVRVNACAFGACVSSGVCCQAYVNACVVHGVSARVSGVCQRVVYRQAFVNACYTHMLCGTCTLWAACLSALHAYAVLTRTCCDTCTCCAEHTRCATRTCCVLHVHAVLHAHTVNAFVAGRVSTRSSLSVCLRVRHWGEI